MKKTIVQFLMILLPAFCAVSGTDKIEVTVLTKSTQSWNGSTLPAYPAGQPEITLLKITIPPHTKLDLHQHPVINTGLMLEGKLTVISAGSDTLRLEKGDALIELVNQWHYGVNPADEPAVIVVFYAGIEGNPITVKQSQ